MVTGEIQGIAETLYGLYSNNIECEMDWLINILLEGDFLKRQKTCGDCGESVALSNRNKLSDKCMYQCTGCFKRTSVRTGSAFEGSKLPLHDIMKLLLYFCQNNTVAEATQKIGCTKSTTVRWFQKFRNDCGLLLEASFERLGGATSPVVEIDETLVVKRKYNRGRNREQRWVFGAIERGTSNFVIKELNSRNKIELERVITSTISEGSTVNTDMWAAYMSIFSSPDSGYIHGFVNHSENFVNPLTGAHTQSIEALWSRLKGTLRRKSQRSYIYLSEYIDEYSFRAKFNGDPLEVFKVLINMFV